LFPGGGVARSKTTCFKRVRLGWRALGGRRFASSRGLATSQHKTLKTTKNCKTARRQRNIVTPKAKTTIKRVDLRSSNHVRLASFWQEDKKREEKKTGETMATPTEIPRRKDRFPKKKNWINHPGRCAKGFEEMVGGPIGTRSNNRKDQPK